MQVLELFSGSQTMRKAFESKSHQVTSVDIKKYNKTAPDTIICDILNWDYQAYNRYHFDCLFIGLPCQSFSKAAGNLHYDSKGLPRSPEAFLGLKLLTRTLDIISYFENAVFYIENPTGKLARNKELKNFLSKVNGFMYRLHQGSFGFYTSKQTDIFTNNQSLILVPQMYRKNGRYSKMNFDNLSRNKRHTYPVAFCELIVFWSESEYFRKMNNSLISNLC